MHDRLNCLCFFCIVLFFVFEKTNVTEVSPPNGRGSVQHQLCKIMALELYLNFRTKSPEVQAEAIVFQIPLLSKALSVVRNFKTS